MLENQIEIIKSKLIEFGNHVNIMLEKSTKGLLEKDEALLKEVIELDEPKCNEMEIDVDELCISTLARFDPKGKLLRTIVIALKMNNDLERIGDHLVNISQSALFLIGKPQVKPLIDIPRMAQEVKKMLSDSVKSFIEEDDALAKRVCENDDIVDSYREQIIRELITYMISDPTTIERALHLIRISGNLERIADLSTNICEDVIFLVKGEIIKHRKKITF
ncbi:MAG: phosphate signaling complex protein PhoU [Candidatus Calescibacterium sp.]|nr:phosphate signaling complex protein PhoU [Candidatus Calescibacterium sp.]MCX7733155.1 phosphate signaling complex protein PhoU [bacterium]MDW8087711.1 phosphate signaling complex protein PhoU [Candidatus Calescibacterium sp.]